MSTASAIDTAVHIPRVTWNRRFLPALQQHLTQKYGAAKANDFYVFGEVAAFVNDKWNRGSVNHSAQFYTWKERRAYVADDVQAALDQFNYENQLGTGNQPVSTNAFLRRQRLPRAGPQPVLRHEHHRHADAHELR